MNSAEAHLVSRNCTVDFILMGVLEADELRTFYDHSKTSLSTTEWQIDWCEDITNSVSAKHRKFEPHEFYERIYHVRDLGTLSLEKPQSKSLLFKRITLYVHECLSPSFQVRGHLALSWSSEQPLSNMWDQIKKADRSLTDFTRSLGLRPLISTWTVRLDPSGSGRESMTFSLKEPRTLTTDLFGENSVNLDSACVVGDTILMKLLEEGREQYLIVCPSHVNQDMALSRLYYLMLAKSKIRALLSELRAVYSENLRNMESQFKTHRLIKKVSPSQVSELLALRENVVRVSDEFRVLKNQVELVEGFLEFHTNDYLNNMQETPIVDQMKGVIESEKVSLKLFYLAPLRSITKSIEENLAESLGYITSISDIFSTQADLQLQIHIERLSIIAIIVAVLSLFAALVAVVK
jgi:hypothetical protein